MILALDIASRLTGWTCGDGASVPACGAWEFPQFHDDYGALLHRMREYLDVTARRFPAISAAVYEAPILVVRGRRGGAHTDKLPTLRKLYSMGPLFELWCLDRGIPCREVDCRAIKRETTGSSFADKGAMVLAVERAGLVLPPGPGREDAADSFGAWLIGVRQFAPQHSRAWDQRIWGRRGLL